MKAKILIIILILCVLSSLIIRGEEILNDKFADLVLKTLTYDRELEQKVSGKIHLGILYSSADKGKAQQLKHAFEARSSFTVKGFSFDVMLIEWKNSQALKDEITKTKFLCLMIMGKLDSILDSIIPDIEKSIILTITKEKSYAEKSCLTMVNENGKVVIYRHDESLDRSNIKLSAEFLKITKII